MRQRIHKISIDHSITFALLLFATILFTAVQLTAQEKNEIANPANIDNQNSPQAFEGEVSIKVGSNTLLKFEEEGPDGGSIFLPDVGTSPVSNTGKLYNNGGGLFWGGTELGTSGTFSDDWDDDGSALFLYSPSRNVGIGTLITETSAKLHVKGNEGVLFQGTYGSGTALNLGAGTRFHFYPKKASLRSGKVDGNQWDDANMGTNSASFGSNTIAFGGESFSSGFESEANGNSSIALGFRNISTGNRSMAIGSQTNAKTFASLAIGRFNSGNGSATSWVENDPLFEIGNGTSALSLANALTVLKNGKVGIGIDNPSYNLHIKSAVGENPFKIQVDNSTKLTVFSNGGTSLGTAATPPANGLLVSGTLKASTIIETNNLDSPSGNVSINDNLYINTTNVGIGTSTPTKKLEVNGEAKFGNAIIGSNGTLINEILKISGTTNASNNTTLIVFPTGYNYNNCFVLSCKVEQFSNSFDIISKDANEAFHISLVNSSFIQLDVPHSNYWGKEYQIVLMRID